MQVFNNTYFILGLIGLAGVIFSVFLKSSKAVAFFLILLPAFNLARKSFNSDIGLIPSFETIGAFILLAIIIFRRLSGMEKPPPRSRGVRQIGIFLAMVFFMFAVCSSIISNHSILSLQILLAGGVVPIICYYITLVSVKTFDDIYNISFGVIGMAIVAGSHSLLNLFNRLGQIGSGLGSQAYEWMYGGNPVVNVFGPPSAGVAAIISALALIFWYWKYGKKYKIQVLIVGIGACLVMFLFSFSRGAWLSSILTVFGCVWVLFRNRKIQFVLLTLTALIIIFATGFQKIVMPILESRLSKNPISSSDRHITGRAYHSILAIKSGVKYPIVGTGLGSYSDMFKKYPAEKIPYAWFAHNLIPTLVTEIGLMGAMAFALFYLLHIIYAFRWKYSGDKENEMGKAIGIGLLGFMTVASTSGCHLVNGLSPINYFCAPHMIVIFILMGVVASGYTISKHSLS